MADNSALKKIIIDILTDKGEMTVDEFMTLALNHPEHGYYSQKMPIGRKGDFITSPEISQLFGEVIAAWCIHVWIEMGRPEKFRLVELGPGKGTLMADILRASKIMPAFQDNVQIALVESNSSLKELQMLALRDYITRTAWLTGVDALPEDLPFILIANEFLDAMPIKQFVLDNNVWKERVVVADKSGELKFTKSDRVIDTAIPLPTVTDLRKNAVYEFSPAIAAISETLAQKVKKCGGYALMIDYGYGCERPPCKDTLQSLYKHRPSSVLSHIGEQDITAHVDFNTVRAAGAKIGCNMTSLCTQTTVLIALGIEIRAAILSKNASNDRQRLTIRAGLQRLIKDDQMGSLFKAMAFYPTEAREPEGFICDDDNTCEI